MLAVRRNNIFKRTHKEYGIWFKLIKLLVTWYTEYQIRIVLKYMHIFIYSFLSVIDLYSCSYAKHIVSGH
jgi:hypothetical protein